MSRFPAPVPALKLAMALGWAGLFAACSVGCGARGAVRIESSGADAVLTPEVRLLAFRPSGERGADLLITDLSREQLDPGVPLDTLEGNITHIHMFLRPRAGFTPIEQTASTTTIRHVVLSRGAVGVYGGGGFLSPKGGPDDRFFGGSIRNAPVVLTGATPSFADPLGASSMSIDIRAPRDEALSRLILIRLGEALQRVELAEAAAQTPVETGDTPPEEASPDDDSGKVTEPP